MDSGARTHQQNRGNATQTGRSGPTQPGNSAESSIPASVKIQDKAAYGGYTHFLSLPLAHPTLVNKLDNFRNTITKEFGIHESIFNKTKSLHLTLRMLELRGEERIKKAAEVIQNVSSKVMDALENRPLLIRLNGLDLMSGTKDEALILYAPAEVIGGESRLLSAIKVITDALIDADLIPRNDTGRSLKLHVTLMKASFKRRANIYDAVVPFDARGIFELYGREEWGEYAISEAHLSQMKIAPNGYFHCCASIPFPRV